MPALAGDKKTERSLIARGGMPFVLTQTFAHTRSSNEWRRCSESVEPATAGCEYDRVEVEPGSIPTRNLYEHWFPALTREDFLRWYRDDPRNEPRSPTKGAYLAYFKELNKDND